MSSKDLASVGITFVDPQNYQLTHQDHLSRMSSNFAYLDSLRKGLLKEAEDKAKSYASQAAAKDREDTIKRAQEIYANSIAKDPLYAPWYDAYKAAQDAEFGMVKKGHMWGIGIITDGLADIVNDIRDSKHKDLTLKSCMASLPDDGLLASLVNKYASGWIAEYCRVIPYETVKYNLEDTKYPQYCKVESEYYRSQPQAMNGLQRLKDTMALMYQDFYQKRFEAKKKELLRPANDRYVAEKRRITLENQEMLDSDTEEVIALIKKLVSAPQAMDGMVRFTYDEIKKRDNGMDKGKHVALIEYTVRYQVFKDHIMYMYDSSYSNPLSNFVFEENNYKLLTSDAQCCAAALALGQSVTLMLKSDPVFEMADITAEGIYNEISLKISYPNAEHTEAISLF